MLSAAACAEPLGVVRTAVTLLQYPGGQLASFETGGDVRVLCTALDAFGSEKSMHPAMNELSQLPVSERLELVEQLWESIAESSEQLPIQEWHRELVKARLADFEGREEELGLSREQVWERVDQRRGS